MNANAKKLVFELASNVRRALIWTIGSMVLAVIFILTIVGTTRVLEVF